jgi:(p)ppGpp synthase/HD superfamily hydrolase
LNSARYADAVSFAVASHDRQTRKGSGMPYIAHPLAVSALVIEYGGDQDQAIAALLHDVIEDCGVSQDYIRDRFGRGVSDIVMDCTDGVPGADGKKAPWRERKEDYLRKLLDKDPASLLVVLCDKVHNAESIVHDLHGQAGKGVFGRFAGGADGTAWYYAKIYGLLEFHGKLPRGLIQRLRAAASEIDRQAQPRYSAVAHPFF